MQETYPRRGAIILVEGGRVALIRRVNARGVYYLFPGGGVEEGETPEESAAREAMEELGLNVEVLGLAPSVGFEGVRQLYYWARRLGGDFGTGKGEEFSSPADSESGTYTPVWVGIGQLGTFNIRPPELAALLASGRICVGSDPVNLTDGL
jgi:8-oxo-dGTP pyrophosphatase MutT (NUDIX family)